MSWDWQVFLSDDGSGRTYLAWMLDAWLWTLAVAGCAWVVALLFGSVIGVLRTAPNRWVAGFANAWVELFRNIPLLVQIFLWYFVVPAMIPPLQELPSFVMVVAALGALTPMATTRLVRPMALAQIAIPGLGAGQVTGELGQGGFVNPPFELHNGIQRHPIIVPAPSVELGVVGGTQVHVAVAS